MHEKPLILTAAPRMPLEQLDARVKLVCLAVWVICVVSTPAGRFALPGAYAALLAAVLGLNHGLAGRFLRRFAPAIPALILCGTLLPFFLEGETIWRWGPVSATREGSLTAARVVTAATLCLAAVALVWASTPQEALLVGLRGVGLPGVFVGALGFMLRYLEVLRPELHRLTDARAARTMGRGGAQRVRSGANVIGTLFLRAHERAERVADAMVARGYDGRPRAFGHAHVHPPDLLAVVVFPSVTILLRMTLGG